MQPSEPKGPAVEDPCEFKQMLAGILAAIQQNNNKLQEIVRADLAANQERVRAELAVNQESVKAEINSIKNDIKVENEKLIKRFELQNQEAKKDSEARRVTKPCRAS
jgi:LPS O-antigen subunit length determinant protein (WzzB/FepE family)